MRVTDPDARLLAHGAGDIEFKRDMAERCKLTQEINALMHTLQRCWDGAASPYPLSEWASAPAPYGAG